MLCVFWSAPSELQIFFDHDRRRQRADGCERFFFCRVCYACKRNQERQIQRNTCLEKKRKHDDNHNKSNSKRNSNRNNIKENGAHSRSKGNSTNGTRNRRWPDSSRRKTRRQRCRDDVAIALAVLYSTSLARYSCAARIAVLSSRKTALLVL